MTGGIWNVFKIAQRLVQGIFNAREKSSEEEFSRITRRNAARAASEAGLSNEREWNTRDGARRNRPALAKPENSPAL